MIETLKPWYAVATPHEDIRAGRMEEAVFAANLWAVVQESAPTVYLDAEEFFRKTSMTVGLRTVLNRVAGALRGHGESGDRVVSLQTAFGGGKTHILIALWHLARHGAALKKSPAAAELRQSLKDRFPEKIGGVAVFTNETCDATQGRRTPDGVHTRTIWGEVAFQLGGKALYEKVRPNDEAQRVPQGLFADVLRAAAPCLILLDELADYCVGAASVPVGDTTLADQTISFIQQLTEAVHQVPGAVVVATLPASKLEVAQSEKGQEAFVTLEKRFQRLGADIKPVADDEIYDVVRARLFESITHRDEPEYPARVAEAYHTMYAAHAGEVPSEATKKPYRDLIERAYPFHPSLIDALYKRWGSHPDFQRTRGVLRLLASVVGDLWNRREGNTQTQHLIQPCHIRWSVDAFDAALTRLWGNAFQSVSAADITGERSNAGTFDEERGGDYRREAIGQGLASAILLGSFGGQADRMGFSAKDLKLACSRYGLNWNYLDGALLELEERCFYLHDATAGTLGKRYWFSTKPTLTKLLVQYRQRFGKENFGGEIIEQVKNETKKGIGPGTSWRIVIDPEADLPEQKSLTLLVLPSSLSWAENGGAKEEASKRVLDLSKKCGGKDRIYRNTLLFLTTAPRGLTKLRQAHRERAALQAVKADYGDQLDDEQKNDLKKRLEAEQQALSEALGPAYSVVLRVQGQEVEACALADARLNFQDHLGHVWKTLVEDEEWILCRVGSVTMQKAGLVPETTPIRVKDAIDAFLRFTDKPMIATRHAVTEGLVQACKDGLVGIGRGATPSNLQARYCKQHVQLDPNEDGLWIIPPFEPETVKVVTPGPPGPAPTPTEGGAPPVPGPPIPPVPTPGAAVPVVPVTAAKVKRFVVRGTVPVENYAELFRCFVGPAVRMNLKKLSIGVQFEMETGEGQALDPNDTTLKSMQEAAKQLGLTFEVKE
jgi:hypothetical protein